MMAAIVVSCGDPTLAAACIQHLIDAAFGPMQGFGEHRMFESCLALLQISQTEHIGLAKFDSLIRWIDFWSQHEDVPLEGKFNLEVTDSSRLLLIQVLCKLVLSTSAENVDALVLRCEEGLRSSFSWHQFASLYIWFGMRSSDDEQVQLPEFGMCLNLNQLGALVAAVPQLKELGLRLLLSATGLNATAESSLEWPHVLITLARKLASLPTALTVSTVDPWLLVSSGAYNLSSDMEDELFDVLEDAETTMTKLQKGWLWTVAAYALVIDCVSQPQVGGPLWSAFSRVLRRAFRAATSLPVESPQRGLLLSCLDSIYYSVDIPHIGAILQYCITADAAEQQHEDSEASYDRIFLAEWLLLHEAQMQHCLLDFSRTKGPTPRVAMLPVYCSFAVQPNLSRQLRARIFTSANSAAICIGATEDISLFPLCVACVSYFTAKLGRLHASTGQSQTAEQVRFHESILSLVLYVVATCVLLEKFF
jgi:hypothetical protein